MERTPFKDTQGRWVTTGLFKEISQTKSLILFSLDEAKALFIETGDPTGYEFATQHLGGWQHWLALKASPKLDHRIREWEEELEAKIRAQGVKRIIDHSRTDKGYQAAKYIAEAGWKPKEVGRPTREKVQRESRVRSKMYDEFKDNVVDMKRKD